MHGTKKYLPRYLHRYSPWIGDDHYGIGSYEGFFSRNRCIGRPDESSNYHHTLVLYALDNSFCAPTFVFLSGTSAFLASQNKAPGKAASFLIKRGLWLVIVEMAVITLGITFNPIYSFVVWQVIWAIGWSMIVLGLLVRFPFYTILAIGILLFFGHDLFDHVISLPEKGFAANLMKVLFTANNTILRVSDGHFIGVFYAILPWTGVMLMGYSMGYWFRKEFPALKRKQLLLATGLSAITLFILLRYFNAYGDPAPWDEQHFLSFLRASKYPPSLLYLFMTLGPSLVALSLLENVHTKWSSVFTVYGRVPFFIMCCIFISSIPYW